MAKVLTLAFGLEIKADHDFPDISEDHWARDYVRALYSNGITTGSGGLFKPNDFVTRAQYAAFLYRALNLNPDFEAEPNDPPKEEEPPVIEEPTENIIDEIIDANPDIFSKDVETHVFANTSPIISKIMKEGLDVVKETNLKIHDVSHSLSLKQPNYQCHIPWITYELYVSNRDNGNFLISYDHYSEQANKIAKSWLKLLMPELAFFDSQSTKK